jgi:hypothetical protein
MFKFYVSKQGGLVWLQNDFNCAFGFNEKGEIIKSNMIEDKNSKKLFDSARKEFLRIKK